jgi:hypothetical protein
MLNEDNMHTSRWRVRVGDSLRFEGVVDVLVQTELVRELNQVVELDSAVEVIVIVEAFELHHENVGQLYDLEALASINLQPESI